MSKFQRWMGVPQIFMYLSIGIFSLELHAMSQKLPSIENEKIEDAQVLAEFSLRASDGTSLKFQPFDRDANLRSVLPPERNANHDLCNKMDFERFSSLVELGTNLIDHQRALTSSEIKLIQGTPRCSPYDTALNVIAVGLGGHSSVSSQVQIASISLSRNKQSGSSLILNTSNNKQVFFNVKSDLSKIRRVSDLFLLQITPQSSGQGLGISFSLKGSHPLDPSNTSHWEACFATRSTRECRYDEVTRRERCEVITTTEPGYQWVESSSQTTINTLEISLVNTQGQSVFRGTLDDFEFDDQNLKGECIPSGQ
jgi:hypothetical protein